MDLTPDGLALLRKLEKDGDSTLPDTPARSRCLRRQLIVSRGRQTGQSYGLYARDSRRSRYALTDAGRAALAQATTSAA